MRLDSAHSKIRSMGIWAWLMIIEKEKDKLSDGGRVALINLREDLEKLSE